MKPVFSIEKVNPEKAWEWLMTSKGNRITRNDHVASLASQMKRGEWKVNNNAITFDKAGTLMDGHHRLLAVVISESTVEMSICRGVDEAARDTIDVGMARTMADHLRFRGFTNVNQLSSYLNACIRLVVGVNVSIKTMDAFEKWMPTFRDGIDTYFELGCWLESSKHMRAAKIAGPLIVAYKADKEKMTKFLTQLRDGTDLKANHPALKLREFLMLEMKGDNRKRTTFDTVASKIFACAKAFLDGRSISKVQPSEMAVEYFRGLYTSGSIRTLTNEARKVRNESRALGNAVTFHPDNKGPMPSGLTLKEFKKTLEQTPSR